MGRCSAKSGRDNSSENFEAHLSPSASSFAVILMTCDDLGRLNEAGEDDRPRARQNVVLELGFAMGVLGRRRVAILHEDGVELPSDIKGVAYYPLDAGGAWKDHCWENPRSLAFTLMRRRCSDVNRLGAGRPVPASFRIGRARANRRHARQRCPGYQRSR